MDLNKRLFTYVNKRNKQKVDILFEEIYNTYNKLVSFIISKYCNNHLDVEELTNDVFISFYKKIWEEEITNIKYYLVTMAKNKAINFIKTRKNDELIEYDDDLVYDKNDCNSLDKYNEMIVKLRNILDDFELELILKHIIYDYTFNDLSIKYNKPLKTIYSTYSRAIKKVRKETM